MDFPLISQLRPILPRKAEPEIEEWKLFYADLSKTGQNPAKISRM
jgi:hypothetical protein